MKHESLEDRLVVRLKQEFPDLNFKQVQLNTKGWDHDVLILDNSFIVRFSKEKLDPKNFEREIRFLDEFRKISNLRIPKYTLISRDKTFGGYEMILGEELTPEKFQTLSSERRQDFVHQIAAFITKLHTIPLESAKDFGFEQYKSWDSELKEKEKWFQDEFYPKMSSSLTLEENTFIQNFVLSFCRSQHSVQPVIGHYDLSHDHIIMAPDGSISGIIDLVILILVTRHMNSMDLLTMIETCRNKSMNSTGVQRILRF